MRSTLPTPAERERLDAAITLLQAGRNGQAVGALRELIASAPWLAETHLRLGVALEAMGDRVAAEAELREALRLDPGCAPAAVKLAAILINRREGEAAVEILAPLADAAEADVNFHTVHGQALKVAGRLEEAAKVYARAVEAAPASGAAEHNLAGVLGDAHRFSESAAATARAFEKGLDAPETWLVRGRALQGLREYDAAEAAFGEAIRRRPAYADALADLAQLVWMRTEDVASACAALDTALAARPADGPLSLAKAKVLEYAGNLEGAYAVLATAIAARETDAELQVAAAQLMVYLDPLMALDHAERAHAAAPTLAPTATAVCLANLALGRADVAATIAEGLSHDWPLDQYPVALAGTAWRMMGDPRYRALYDYDRLVHGRTIETPAGWGSLEGFLNDLAVRLHELQALRAHPVGQSLRFGTQTPQALARMDDPVIMAFFAAIDAPIREYMAILKEVDDRMGRRYTGDYRFTGSWSALLRPGGYHVNHLHPKGWISSACHITLPGAVDIGQQGWLTFGQPGVPTMPPLEAEHFVKPQAGRLVLFPSYMWHGTETFWGDEPRLTIAFDALPA